MLEKTLIELHQRDDFSQHEEIRRLNVQQTKKIEWQGENIDRLTLAMFGNPDDKNDIGTKDKVDEIYKLLVAGNVITKTLAWAFGVVVAVISAGYMIFSFVKDVKRGD